MGVMETFLVDLKTTIVDILRDIVKEEITHQTTDKWLNKKQLAEYWGVSESYINKNLDKIPHSAQTPISFLKSEADLWRKGEVKKLEIVNTSKVNISNYKSNNFKIGKK